MLGAIHVILKDLVLTKFGAAKWAEILVELGQESDEDLLVAEQHYEDDNTFAMVTVAAKVLGVSLDQALVVYGEYFVDTVHMGGHLRMMRTMGDNIGDFLGNVNHLHYGLEKRFKDADFPRFNIKATEEPDTFIISYWSCRGTALAALVEGVLSRGCARLHHQHLEMERLPEPLEGYGVSWRARTSAIPPERRLPEPDLGPKAVAAGGLWHTVMASLACGAKPRKADPGLTYRQRRALDHLETRVRGHVDPASLLMHAVRAEHVAAEWDNFETMDKASAFWGTKVGSAADYQLSRPSQTAQRFVTHSWSPPGNWKEVMGETCSYADIKAMELYMVAKDIAEDELGEGSSWKDVTFWVDKCCIPQQHSLTPRCIELIEEFIRRSDGMVVLFSWDYYDRLWCVYEWAAFLVYHSAAKVQICSEMFLRPSTRALFMDSIRNFSVRNAKCFHAPDRALLKEKISQYYVSEAAFERFAKCTAIAVLSRSAVHRAGRSAWEMEVELRPLRELCQELGLPGLHAALLKPDPILWRRMSVRERTWGRVLPSEVDKMTSTGSGESNTVGPAHTSSTSMGPARTLGSYQGSSPFMSSMSSDSPMVKRTSTVNWQMGYKARIDTWFMKEVLPVVEAVKAECVLDATPQSNLDLVPASLWRFWCQKEGFKATSQEERNELYQYEARNGFEESQESISIAGSQDSVRMVSV